MEKGVLTANEYGFIFGVMKMFKNYILVIVIHVCKYIKNTNTYAENIDVKKEVEVRTEG